MKMTGDSAGILVTGGTGFFGRSLVRKLLDMGHSVRVMSRSAGSATHPFESIYRGDLRSDRNLQAALIGCNAVFHCAGEKHDAGRMLSVNVDATRRLFELSRDTGIKFFCHLSSVGVIGKTHLTVVDEDTSCNPMNRYEETKLMAETIVGRGLDEGRVVILRPTNIFGAETLAALLKNSLRSKVRLLLTGDEGSHSVYVKDVGAAAIRWLQIPPERPVETFIVSSDEEPGNTHRAVQGFIASRVPTAPRPPRFVAPLAVPYGLRLLRMRNSNRGDLIYSSRKLRASGFEFPYGLRKGLEDALRGAQRISDGADLSTRK
jgi:nucleoside-diphosphate-sugar epimerase